MSFRGRRFNGRRGSSDRNFNSYRGGWKVMGNSDGSRDSSPRNYGDRGEEGHSTKRLSEEEIGVTEYVSKLKGFDGIIKSRFSDFQVSEVNLEGEIAKLTDLSVPVTDKEEAEEDEGLALFSKYSRSSETLPGLVWDRIQAMTTSEQQPAPTVEVDATLMSKEDRTKVHEVVKKVFGAAVVGSTITRDDKKYIVFTKYCKGVKIDRRSKWAWPGAYVHFVVYKENCDTMEAASQIAESLRISHVRPSCFGYAGTKDRRAKTSQWFSIKKTEPLKISGACKHLRHIHVGNFTFKDDHLKLGCLRGNRFRIALRNVQASDEEILAAMSSIQENGFINYFGLQRFGTRADVPTYTIGRCLLQGKYQEAVDLILEPRGPFARQLRKYRETRNAQRSLFGVPRNCSSIEVKLLQGLDHFGDNDLVNALERIPRNTRLLYIHSYQSWVWNRCVSERIRRFGLLCHAGDLAPLHPELLKGELEPNIEESAELDGDDIPPSEEPSLEKTEIDKNISQTETSLDTKTKMSVKILTEEDVKASSYTINAIVLPLPGFSIEYPPNMKDYYEKLLREDGLGLELKQKVKSYSLGGVYRRVILKPEDVSWRTVRYSDPYGDLIASDLDELRKKEPLADLPEGKYKALVLQLTLTSSTYATMALREILKTDTSSEKQAAQNDYHKKADEEQKPEPEKRKLEDGSADVQEKKLKTNEVAVAE